ncbi:MAG TPA: TonB-dependent receptor, partial [Blastocatellia bacterium]|nr:TonB-dependent receptor [Blastocatellia bacterium]
RSFLSPNFVNEVLGKYVRERIETSTDYYDEAVEVLGAYNGGGSQCCPALSQRQRFTFNDNLSLVRGAHFFKSGLSMVGLRMNDASENNFGGTWQFSSLTFQRLRRPILYTLNVGDPNLRYGLWQFAGYVQDEIKLKPNFTLTPGLRYEAQTQAGTYRNFAPRLSLAWSPTKAGNTVIRSGAGLYFQLLDDAQLTKALRFDGVRQRQVVIARPRFPNPFGNRPFESFPISVNRLASDLQLPQQWHLSTGIERSFPRDAVVTLTYTYVRGVHFFRARDVNAPSVDGVRPQPQFWRITQLESSATSTTHRLQLGYSQTLNPNITLFGNYTWGRMMDDTDGPESYPMDNYQLRNERGYAALDMRHQVFFGAMFMTPFGLEFAPMFYFNTGQPYNITTGLDENNDSIINDRPTGFARNAGRGPNYTSLDLSISRQLNFGPRAQDQDAPFGINFSVQFTNLLNHTNFANFNGIQTSPFFGRANAAQEARQVMLLVNFNFH